MAAEEPKYSARITKDIKSDRESWAGLVPKSETVSARNQCSWGRLFGKYWHLKLVQLSCAVYIAILSYSPVGTFGTFGGFVDPVRGFIVDTSSSENTASGVIWTRGVHRAIVAENVLQMVCIGVTRTTAFLMYPALILVFATKFRFTLALINTTPFALWLFQDVHDLHVYCGWVIAVNGVLHTLFHLFRWANQGNLNLVISHWSGISGCVMCASLLVVCVPMMFKKIRDWMSYEWRKSLHYFFIVFAIGLACHSTPTSVPNGGFTLYIFSALVVWYLFDALLVNLYMSEKIETTSFQILPSGVQLTMAVSDRFNRQSAKGGFCYLCFPWIDKSQWHAFSLFENPANPRERQIFLLRNGDWTKRLYELLQRSTARPVWIQGPFPSPFTHASAYDNLIMVAAGIGITPALSIIRAHKESRRTNLIWAIRDPDMLEFFLDNEYLDHPGWNLIFYTGKTPLKSAKVKSLTGTNTCVVASRPNINVLVRNIIYGIESGKGKPEHYSLQGKYCAVRAIAEKLQTLDEAAGMTVDEKVDELLELASDCGYIFTDALLLHLNNPGHNLMTAMKSESDLQSNNMSSSEWTSTFSEYSVVYRYFSKIAFPKCAASAVTDMPTGRVHVSSTTFNVCTLRDCDYLTAASLVDLLAQNHKNEYDLFLEKGLSNGKVLNRSLAETIAKQITLGFQPWREMEQADMFCQNLSSDVLASWGILYCGGSNELERQLRLAAAKYSVDFYSEAFAW